jgi:hypothetical protein
MMTVTTRLKAEAECIANELGNFGCEIAKDGRGWRVTVAGDEQLAQILTALEKCLADNGIASVVVDVNGRTYVMEAAPNSAAAPISPGFAGL